MDKRYMLATVMALCCAMDAKTEGADSTAPSDGAAAGASKADAGTAGAPCKWQYQFDVEGVKALLWLPPNAETVRGLLFGYGFMALETDPTIRAACADSGIAVCHMSSFGLFIMKDGNTSEGDRLLRILDVLAERSGHAELRRVPWITYGYCTAGIHARNVAYWKPERVAAVLHVRSGNFHAQNVRASTGSLVGVPVLAVNGQLEIFGPDVVEEPAAKPTANGIPLDARYGWETQWLYVRKDIQKFRGMDPNYLMSLWVDRGGDHHHSGPEMAKFIALYIRKTAQYRIPAQLPAGEEPVRCLPLKAEDGWLTDPRLENPKHAPAPYREYTGDKTEAMWQYDREIAEVSDAWHRRPSEHQVMEVPEGQWLDEGDGWTFKVSSHWLTKWPELYGGRLVGTDIGHSGTPLMYRGSVRLPMAQTGADTFRPFRFSMNKTEKIDFAAFHNGDEKYRPAIRWGEINVPRVTGQKQIIDFPAVPDIKVGDGPFELKAKASSGLPIYYEVEYGPVIVVDGKILIRDVPAKAKFPLPCRVTAYQIGRRVAPAVERAAPVSREFCVVMK